MNCILFPSRCPNEEPPESPARVQPAGVTVLALLSFLVVALCGLGAAVDSEGLPPSPLARWVAEPFLFHALAAGAYLAFWGIPVPLIFIVFGGVAGATGVGLWKLERWARTLTIVLSAIGLVFSLGLGTRLGGLGSLGKVGSALGLLFASVYGVVIWYMMQPHVQCAFRTPIRPLSRADWIKFVHFGVLGIVLVFALFFVWLSFNLRFH